MTRFIDEADRLEGALLPETIDEYVSEENPVRVIDAFVGALDLPALGFEGVEPEATGHSAHHPATMLKQEAKCQGLIDKPSRRRKSTVEYSCS